jgi:peptidoglycan/xylan/chitin deacetylase (PgdA/CDA1 family)
VVIRLARAGRHALIGGLAVMLAAGCSWSPDKNPLTPPTPEVCATAEPTPTAEVAAGLVPGLTLETRSDPASFVHATTPVLPQATELTGALRSHVEQDLARYRTELAAAGGAGEFNVSWEVVGASAATVGVLLRTRRSVAELRTTSREVMWLDQAGRRLLRPAELFTADGWAELTRRLGQPGCAGSAFRAELLSEAFENPDGRVRLSVAFGGNGNLVVIVSPVTPAAEAFDRIVPAADVSTWLSAAGQSAQRSATDPEPLAPAPGPLPGPPRPQPAPTKRPVPEKPVIKKPPGKKPVTKEPTAKKPATKKPTIKKPVAKKRTEPVLPTRRPDCRRDRCVALTFDDGPGPYTADLVAKLRRARAPATFFMVGEHIDAFPGLARHVAEGGFEIGNHSYTHADLTHLSAGEVERELARTSKAIRRATGRPVTLMRPPYGARNHAVDLAARQAGLTEVLWDADTLDWLHRSPAYVTKRALRKAKRGSIILMHDIHPTTVKAVPGLIRRLRADGYTLVTVSELGGPGRKGPGHSDG